jgi:uncharacterized delta-60 repeat protein
LFRLDEYGDIDTTFNSGNNDGIVTTDFAGAQDYARAMTVQADGKILVAGYAIVGSQWDFALARYDSNGVLDAGFGNGGKITTNFGSSAEFGYAIALMGDKIVVAGCSIQGIDSDFAIARYLSDGSLDTSFAGTGKVLADFNNQNDCAYAVKVQDGKILVGGYSEQSSNYDFTLVRYLDDGSLDSGFGSGGNGIVRTNIATNSDEAHAMTLTNSGDILLAGYTGAANSTNLALARYSRDGILDPNFGNNGTVITDIAARRDQAFALTLDIRGKVVLAGLTDNGLDNDFLLVRYHEDGALDTEFGTAGKLVMDFASGDDEAHTLVVLSNGDLIAVGQADNGGQTDVAVLRVPQDGDPYTRFNINVNVISLQGSGLILQNNNADDLHIAQDGIYSFATPLPDDAPYAVSILQQPSSPYQSC